MELELIPRLLAHARGGGASRSTHPAIARGDVDAFVRELLAPDENRGPTTVFTLMDHGASLEQVCLELLAPAARSLGAMWEEDEADFLDVTVGLGRMQRILRDLGARVNAPVSSDAGQAFLCGMKEEQHSLGLAMVAEFFVADGWGVTVGPPLGVDEVEHEVRARWYDVVGLTAGVGERLPRIRESIARIRASSLNADLAILVGGPAFNADPSLVDQVGADASAPDAAQAPMVARTLVHTRRARQHDTLSQTDASS